MDDYESGNELEIQPVNPSQYYSATNKVSELKESSKAEKEKRISELDRYNLVNTIVNTNKEIRNSGLWYRVFGEDEEVQHQLKYIEKNTGIQRSNRITVSNFLRKLNPFGENSETKYMRVVNKIMADEYKTSIENSFSEFKDEHQKSMFQDYFYLSDINNPEFLKNLSMMSINLSSGNSVYGFLRSQDYSGMYNEFLQREDEKMNYISYCFNDILSGGAHTILNTVEPLVDVCHYFVSALCDKTALTYTSKYGQGLADSLIKQRDNFASNILNYASVVLPVGFSVAGGVAGVSGLLATYASYKGIKYFTELMSSKYIKDPELKKVISGTTDIVGGYIAHKAGMSVKSSVKSALGENLTLKDLKAIHANKKGASNSLNKSINSIAVDIPNEVAELLEKHNVNSGLMLDPKMAKAELKRAGKLSGDSANFIKKFDRENTAGLENSIQSQVTGDKQYSRHLNKINNEKNSSAVEQIYGNHYDNKYKVDIFNKLRDSPKAKEFRNLTPEQKLKSESIQKFISKVKHQKMKPILEKGFHGSAKGIENSIIHDVKNNPDLTLPEILQELNTKFDKSIRDYMVKDGRATSRWSRENSRLLNTNKKWEAQGSGSTYDLGMEARKVAQNLAYDEIKSHSGYNRPDIAEIFKTTNKNYAISMEVLNEVEGLMHEGNPYTLNKLRDNFNSNGINYSESMIADVEVKNFMVENLSSKGNVKPEFSKIVEATKEGTAENNAFNQLSPEAKKVFNTQLEMAKNKDVLVKTYNDADFDNDIIYKNRNITKRGVHVLNSMDKFFSDVYVLGHIWKGAKGIRNFTEDPSIFESHMQKSLWNIKKSMNGNVASANVAKTNANIGKWINRTDNTSKFITAKNIINKKKDDKKDEKHNKR